MMSAPETTSEIFYTRTARIYLDEDGIIRSIAKDGAELTRQDAVDGFAIMKQLCGDRKRPFLADMRPIASADTENREYAARAEHAAYIAAAAVLADNPITRIITNLFLSVYQPAYPTRMFTSEEEGIEWLRQYL
jgi:hypothetical protein